VSSSGTEGPVPSGAGSSTSDGEAAVPDVSGQTVEVTMPQMGISVSEGTILEWRKRPGDWVEADETVCDVTTDKVDVEIPSPATGRIERLLAEPGVTVPVGEPIAEIDAAARPGEAHREEAAEPRAVEAEATAEAGSTQAKPESAEPTGNGEADRSRFHSPVVRRIADKHDIDLDRVEGTGIGGRVRKRDVLAFIESGEHGAEPETPAERPLHIESPYQAEQARAAEVPAKPAAPMEVSEGRVEPAEQPPPGRREEMSPMRQAIAEHMLSSRRTAAHCTTIVEVDMSRVAARRAQLKEAMTRRGVPLTYLAFVARATVEALQEHPVLNASVEGSEIVYHDDVNLGIAVALDDGLIVPVIPRAQRLSLEGIAASIADVASRARSKQLQPDEVHGGTFTITNPGQFGAVLATPIINQPQVAILDLEAIVKRPVVVEGPEGTDSIAIRPMTYLPMSWDHRALDGATAAKFLSRVKALLEGEGTG
jgi:2-oxoglutarate dehydrogenase dihydrolipoamide succinyltransferase (E2 component)